MSVADDLARLNATADRLSIEKTIRDAKREIAYAKKPQRDREALAAGLAKVREAAADARKAEARRRVASLGSVRDLEADAAARRTDR